MGGGWANAVYSNNLYEPSDYEYLGCYTDDGHRDFKFGPQQYGYDQDSCREACDDYAYFALQHNGWCSCDNEYGTPSNQYTKVDDSECGANGLGGGWRNAVYSNGLYIPRDLKTPDDQ